MRSPPFSRALGALAVDERAIGIQSPEKCRANLADIDLALAAAMLGRVRLWA